MHGHIVPDVPNPHPTSLTKDIGAPPGAVAEAMTSRSEDPVAVSVPTLLPEQPRPFPFGKTTRARISGWAQKAVGDRKIREKKATAAALASWPCTPPPALAPTGASGTPRMADSTWTRPPRSVP